MIAAANIESSQRSDHATSLKNRRLPDAGVCCVVCLLALLVLVDTAPLAQTAKERFWLAVRYDTSEVLIYFDLVKFGNIEVPGSVGLPAPMTLFPFPPIGLSVAHVRRLQRTTGTERFSIGDRYDLLLSNGRVSTVTLTRYVGSLNDEASGTDSFVGALARVPKEDRPFLHGYQAARRHRSDVRVPSTVGASPLSPRDGPPAVNTTLRAGLTRTPVPASTAARLVTQLHARILGDTASSLRPMALRGPAIAENVQRFRTAGGALRYLVSARLEGCRAIAVGSDNPLRIFEVDEEPYCNEKGGPPRLLNVVDLDAHRTGLILDHPLPVAVRVSLLEYKEGLRLSRMPDLQTFSAGD